MNRITYSNIAVLVNDTQIDFFSPSRGIRQGDPMSPYSFIICMEYPIHLYKSLGRYSLFDSYYFTQKWAPILASFFSR